jgi:hypothetical protein
MLQNKWEVFQDLFNEDKDRLISYGIREEETAADDGCFAFS